MAMNELLQKGKDELEVCLAETPVTLGPMMAGLAA